MTDMLYIPLGSHTLSAETGLTTDGKVADKEHVIGGPVGFYDEISFLFR